MCLVVFPVIVHFAFFYFTLSEVSVNIKPFYPCLLFSRINIKSSTIISVLAHSSKVKAILPTDT